MEKKYLDESQDDFTNRENFLADIAVDHVSFQKTKLRLGRFKDESGVS